MDEQQLQEMFIQYLAQKSGAQNEQELNQYIQSLGEEGLQQAYAEFMQLVQQQQGGQSMMSQAQPTQMARNGAKLEYINYLRGKCPEGYEIGYFKRGGHLCKTCMKKQQVGMEAGYMDEPADAVEAFKCGRSIKKKKKAACGTKIDSHKRGGGMNGTPYTRTQSDEYNWVDTKKDPQGRTSTRTVTEDGTLYTGRNGKSGMEGTAVGDSIKGDDWKYGERVQNAPKKKVTKHADGTGKGGVKQNTKDYPKPESFPSQPQTKFSGAGIITRPLPEFENPQLPVDMTPYRQMEQYNPEAIDWNKYPNGYLTGPAGKLIPPPRVRQAAEKKANGGSFVPFINRGLR